MFPSFLFKFVSKRLKRKNKNKNKTNIFPIVMEASFSLTFDRSCFAMPKAVFRQPAKPILFWYYSSWFWWGITWDLGEKPSSEQWKISPHTIAEVGDSTYDHRTSPTPLKGESRHGVPDDSHSLAWRQRCVKTKDAFILCTIHYCYYANILSCILLDIIQTRNIYCWRNVAGYKVRVEAILTF